MGILKITDGKRVGVDPSSEEGSEQIHTNLPLGFLNNKGQFCLRTDDLAVLSKQFDLLYLNRIQNLKKILAEKRGLQQSPRSEAATFKPQISHKTEQIAIQYRQKLAEQLNEEKVEIVDWLAQTGNKDEWRKYAK
jgi:hypothetical protein